MVSVRIVIPCPGADFTNRLKLSQLSLCIRIKTQNRLKSVREIGPWFQSPAVPTVSTKITFLGKMLGVQWAPGFALNTEEPYMAVPVRNARVIMWKVL